MRRSFRIVARTIVGACVGGVVGLGFGAVLGFASTLGTIEGGIVGAIEGGIAGCIAGAAEVNLEAEIGYADRFVMHQDIEDGLLVRSGAIGALAGFSDLYLRLPQLVHEQGIIPVFLPFPIVAGSAFGALAVMGLNVNSLPTFRGQKVKPAKVAAAFFSREKAVTLENRHNLVEKPRFLRSPQSLETLSPSSRKK